MRAISINANAKKIAIVVIGWFTSSGVMAYILLNFVLPINRVVSTAKSLNSSGKYNEAVSFIEKYEKILPPVLYSKIKSELIIEKAKSQCGMLELNGAESTIEKIDVQNLDRTARTEYYLIVLDINVSRFEATKAISETDSGQSILRRAKDALDKIDLINYPNSISAITTKMKLFNDLADNDIELESSSQGRSSLYYKRAQESAKLADPLVLNFLQEYISSINGLIRLNTDMGDSGVIRSEIQRLKFINEIATDFSLIEHQRYTAHEIAHGYEVLNEKDRAIEWYTKSEEFSNIQLRTAKSKSDSDWLNANVCTSKFGIARIHLKENKDGLAADEYQECAHSPNAQIQSIALLALGKIALRERTQNGLHKARLNLLQAKNLILSSNGRKIDLPEVELWLGHLEKISKNNSQALKHYFVAESIFSANSQVGTHSYQAAKIGMRGGKPSLE